MSRRLDGGSSITVGNAFGNTEPLRLGVEEELMILDATSLAQVAGVDRILARLEGAALPGRAKTELFASVVEINTEPCTSAAEVEAALRELRRLAADAAGAEGLALAAAGSHPFARPEDQPIVQEERYTTFAGHGGRPVRRQGVQGLHVHVAMESADDCWRCLELILPWLPLVLALSANSPWFAGELTGMASNRAPVLAELPRAGAPPAVGSYAEWEAWVERLVALGVAQDATRMWWDVRPHPLLGTLEVRMPDQPTDVRLSAAFAALLQALCAAALAGELPSPAPQPDRGRADYAQNRWSAARFGPQADLLHPDGRRLVPAAELAAELLALLGSAARRLGGGELLALVDPRGCEADRQSAQATAIDAAADLVARTVG